MSRGRASLAAAVALVVVLLSSVAASARTNRAEFAQAAEFDAIYAAAWSALNSERDEQGLSYQHAGQRGPSDMSPTEAMFAPGPRADLFSRWRQNETDWARFGQGADRTLFYRNRIGRTNVVTLASLTPAGYAGTFVLVSDRLRRPMIVPPSPGYLNPYWGRTVGPLVNTPWIVLPGSSTSTWDPCTWPALDQLCDLDAAFRTTRAVVPGLPLLVERRPDGSRIARTGIRLLDLIDTGVSGLRAQNAGALLPNSQQLVPFQIEVDASGRLTAIRLRGLVQGDSARIAFDEGVEFRGPAGPSDVPTAPNDPMLLTVVSDNLELIRFLGDTRSFFENPGLYQPDWRPDLPPLPLQATGPPVLPQYRRY